MKKHIYAIGAFVLAFLISGLPVVALAERNSPEDSLGQVSAPSQGTRVSSPSDEVENKQDAKVQDVRVEVTSSDDQKDRDRMSNEDRDNQEINFDLEDDENPANSFDELKQKIEKRKNELKQEVASSSKKHKKVIENANEVRLAVHSLLASKELLGGIGPQVSEIAKKMNDSVATTTNAEAKIQSRGFLLRLFFGGGKTSAEVIAQEASQNQKRIANLTELLTKANVPADVQIVLKEQITALETVQTHLQDLAQKEKSSWGIFSWRF